MTNHSYSVSKREKENKKKETRHLVSISASLQAKSQPSKRYLYSRGHLPSHTILLPSIHPIHPSRSARDSTTYLPVISTVQYSKVK